MSKTIVKRDRRGNRVVLKLKRVYIYYRRFWSYKYRYRICINPTCYIEKKYEVSKIIDILNSKRGETKFRRAYKISSTNYQRFYHV